MKITKRQLKRIIKEEKEALLAEQAAARPELVDYTDFLVLATTDRAAAVEWLKEFSKRRTGSPSHPEYTDEHYEHIVGVTITSLNGLLRNLQYAL